jgi:hypothetical protein
MDGGGCRIRLQVVTDGRPSLDGNLFDDFSRMWSPYGGHNESYAFPVEIQGFHQCSSIDFVADSMQSIGESISFSFRTFFVQTLFNLSRKEEERALWD